MQNNRYPKLEPGKFYHIYNRGNNSQDVFHSEFEVNSFLSRWERFITPVAETFAYSILKNHFHAAVRVRDSIYRPNLKIFEELGIDETNKDFSRFFTSFAMSLHAANGTNGAVFKRRFQRNEVSTDDRFKRLIAYILFNPQRHRLTDDATTYRYGSYQFIDSTPPPMLAQEELFRLFGGLEEVIRYLDLYREQYFPAPAFA